MVDKSQPPVRYTLAVWLATGFGIGLVTPAPGTVGALVWGLPLTLGICYLPDYWSQLAAIIAVNAVGVPLATRAARDLGGVHDHQAIVWDEIATVPIAFLLVPIFGWPGPLIGFVLIRLFDILKPPPARWCEKLPGGWGIMADDWVAGGYACVTMVFLRWWKSTW